MLRGPPRRCRRWSSGTPKTVAEEIAQFVDLPGLIGPGIDMDLFQWVDLDAERPGLRRRAVRRSARGRWRYDRDRPGGRRMMYGAYEHCGGVADGEPLADG